MIWIGVDPGAKGGYAIIDESRIVYSTSTRTFPWDDEMFVCEMRGIKNIADGAKIIAAVEKVGSMPHDSHKAAFNFGHSLGYIEGVLSALGIPYQLVPPAKWKKEFSLIGKDKKASIETCRKLFPDLNLLPTPKCRVPSDGLAEATLLALYAARNFSKG